MRPRLLLAIPIAFGVPAQAAAPARIDHIILAVPDLDQAVADFAARGGVRPAIGGSHPGRGTRNALLSLGNGAYLELFALNPAQPLDNGDTLLLRSLERPTPIGWAVSASDERRIRDSYARGGIGLSPSEPGARRKPDGEVLRWTSFGFVDAGGKLLPFFIHWADPARHPSRTSPGGCRLRSLTLVTPKPDELGRALAPLRLPVAIRAGASERMLFALRCPKGDLVFD